MVGFYTVRHFRLSKVRLILSNFRPFLNTFVWTKLGSLANLAAFLPLLLLGMFWTWLYERTGDLTASILSHAIFNGLNFAWLLLSVAKTDA